MSETVRNFSLGESTRPAGPRRSLRVPGGLAALFLLIAVPFVVYLFWISRDTRAIEEFLVDGRELELVVRDPLDARYRLANSYIWSLLPGNHAVGAIPDAFRTDIALPEWVTRNLITSYAYIGADVSESLDNVLLATRVSRVGAVIERAQRFKPSVARDDAGGVGIYYWSQHGVYYALRGRVLLVSPSRRTLITALTLHRNERAPRNELAGLFAAGAEDVRGRYTCAATDALANYVHSISFAVETDASRVVVKARGATQPAFRDRLAGIIATDETPRLPAVPEGPLQVSVNFGQPLRETWASLGVLLDNGWFTGAHWSNWESAEAGTYAEVLTRALGPAGPGVAVAWRGFDLDEIIPAPIVVGFAETANGSGAMDVVSLVGEDWPDEDCALPRAYAAQDGGVLRVPSISGPSLEAVIEQTGEGLRFSSSASIVEDYFAQDRDKPAPGNGHFYAATAPNDVIDRLAETGAFLAQNAMLADHTPESWAAEVEKWRARWSPVERMETLLAANGDYVQADIKIVLNPAGD